MDGKELQNPFSIPSNTFFALLSIPDTRNVQKQPQSPFDMRDEDTRAQKR